MEEIKISNIIDSYDNKLSPIENVKRSYNFVTSKYPDQEFKKDELFHHLNLIRSKFIVNWRNSGYKKIKFSSTHKIWLASIFNVDKFIDHQEAPSTSPALSPKKRGRKSKDFLELSDRSKRRALESSCKKYK
jgi:hypothetical protein